MIRSCNFISNFIEEIKGKVNGNFFHQNFRESTKNPTRKNLSPIEIV